METGIYVRVQDEDGNWQSLDIGDPAFPRDSLVLWLASKDEEYLMRLVMILLGRKEEED